MSDGVAKPVALVIAPMPLFPCSAGNRRRLLSTCEFLKQEGFDIDFAYLAHEDHIYRRFGQHPPTDMQRMSDFFRQTWLIELEKPLRLRTGADYFGIDDWCPEELHAFVRWYFEQFPLTNLIIVNYAFLSACLLQVPSGVLRVIDTHDRFADRRDQYLPFRLQPNFFFTDIENETIGLGRADIVIAIQPTEKAYFEASMERDVALLMPFIAPVEKFEVPSSLKTIGFMGHGNDANLVSISAFIGSWLRNWRSTDPVLIIAGEICRSLPSDMGPGILLMGYVDSLKDFFKAVDLVVAPMLMGTGLKLKVVEALAHGKPIIGTPVAFEGLASNFADHNLPLTSDMIERLQELVDKPEIIPELVRECEEVYDQYLKSVDLGMNQLAAEFKGAVEIVETKPYLSFDIDILPMAEFAFGDVLVTRQTATDSLPCCTAELGILFATESLALMPGSDQRLPGSVRTRWWIKFAQSMQISNAKRGAVPDMKDLALNLAPLLSEPAASIDKAALSDWAASVISRSQVDWSSRAQNLTIGEKEFNFAFNGPSFLLRPDVSKRIFLIGPPDAAAISIINFELCGLSFARLRPPNFGLRCGNTTYRQMTLRGDIQGSPLILHRQSMKLIVVSYGLVGRIDIEEE